MTSRRGPLFFLAQRLLVGGGGNGDNGRPCVSRVYIQSRPSSSRRRPANCCHVSAPGHPLPARAFARCSMHWDRTAARHSRGGRHPSTAAWGKPPTSCPVASPGRRQDTAFLWIREMRRRCCSRCRPTTPWWSKRWSIGTLIERPSRCCPTARSLGVLRLRAGRSPTLSAKCATKRRVAVALRGRPPVLAICSSRSIRTSFRGPCDISWANTIRPTGWRNTCSTGSATMAIRPRACSIRPAARARS